MQADISTFWSVIVEIGLFGWIGSTIAFIFKAITPDNKLVKRNAALWGALIVLFYALWILGLVKA